MLVPVRGRTETIVQPRRYKMIDVKELTFKYKDAEQNTIHGIDFTVKRGEIFGFLGPSGAGKSTTQKILTGLNKGYQGSAQVDGKELKYLGREYYENIGVSFELPNLYTSFTARENLEFFKSFYKGDTEAIDTLLDRVGLFADADKKVKEFSKGMKMRLNFIRSLINKPSLIFLDEPTSGLDPVNASLIKEIILDKKREGATIFITTHNMQVASELCDHVAFIVDGNIKITDSPKNLMYKFGKKELLVETVLNGDVMEDEFNLVGIGENREFLELIANREVKTMHSKDATLDDVFIKVTGRSLS